MYKKKIESFSNKTLQEHSKRKVITGYKSRNPASKPVIMI